MSLKKESRSSNNFFPIFPSKSKLLILYAKDKVIILCFLFFYSFLTFHKFISLEVLRLQLIFPPPLFFLSYFASSDKCNNCVIIIVLIPSARPIVKICATFSIKITFFNGHGETSSSSVLKRTETNKRNRNGQDKTNKKQKQKEKQNKTENCECMFNVISE